MNAPTAAQDWELQFERIGFEEDLAKDLLAMPENRYLAPLVKPGLRILEAGSGNGRYVFAFAKVGASAVGVDFSKQLTDRVDVEAKRLGLENVTSVTGDIMDLPFPKESFDLYTSFGVYEHFVPHQHEVLFKEAYRVLKPGGVLYLEVPQFWSAWTPRREIRYWFRRFGSTPLVWQRNMRRNYLVRCGSKAGFLTLESHVFDAWYGLEKGFSLKDKTRMKVPNPFYLMRPVFRRIADFCERREWLGHTLVYIGKKPFSAI
jgi:ubiquinone/menaquinone biosynthesis C-methylase UbiE